MPVRSGYMPVKNALRPGRAALHGDIVHEPCTLFREAVDVGRFPDAHAIGVGLNLHPADVVGHDEEDVGLAGRRLR